MTGTNDPAGFAPVVALFCTGGMEAFLSNAIKGILQTGVEARQIYVGCPLNARRSVKSVTRSYSADIHVVSNPRFSENASEMTSYSSFGSRSFTEISWKKVFFIRQLIEVHAHVVYADLDVSWIRNPLPYLIQVARVYPIAIQTEGLPRFPPALCWGFASFTQSKRTTAFLDALIEFHSAQLGSDDVDDDQVAAQHLIENDITWLRDICPLPEMLFPNGLGYRNLLNSGASPCRIEGELMPFVFHANWTVGIEDKRKLLTGTGTWLLDDAALVNQATATEAAAAGADLAAQSEPSPLLTVIYPVFDVRGDVDARVRLWTEQQDLDSPSYRVIVVAGAGTELDEARLRRVLRSQDAILRVAADGREADYWNEGAQQAGTPWLLFVEAHGVAQRDNLSTLAAWIAANPDGEACNFRIDNIGGHHVAALMKRWFAEIQAGWSASSTWPRFHRTAFAIRSDVFEEVGPFEPEYGQFAPPLLSARMNQCGYAISALPTSVVMHDDSREISHHHDDTADYAQGEMNARIANDPIFFEKYFGPPPSQDANMILAARHARSMVGALVVTALHRPRKAMDLLAQTTPLWSAALVSLRDRARMLAARTAADEFLVMHLPVSEATLWRRFLKAHSRVVRTGQMIWMAHNPLQSLQTRMGKRKWPIAATGRQTVVGLYSMEHLGEGSFRWTQPVFLLRLALVAGQGTLTLETRNLRPGLVASDMAVVAGGRMLSSTDIAIDGGKLTFNIKAPSVPPCETDVVVIVRELAEPSVNDQPGRRLGLPLFSISFNYVDSYNRSEA